MFFCYHISGEIKLCVISPFPQIDIIGAMIIVWRVRGKIITSLLCSIVCNSCAQCNAHTYEQTLTVVCWLDLAFLWLYCVLQFICVRFSFLSFFVAFSDLMLLVGWQEGHRPVKTEW